MNKEFPQHFLWGAATAAHQVEGHQQNDWSMWEKENNKRLAHQSGHNLAYLQDLLNYWPHDWESNKLLAADPQNYLSGDGVDHYYRYEQDFDLIKELNLGAFRFSVEWSRVQQSENTFSTQELDHYVQYVDALLEKGITPFLTLQHFTLPDWVADQGGWANPQIVDWFGKYVTKLVEVLGGKVPFWLTINEPLIYASATYLHADWPPAHKQDFLSYWRCINHMCAAHKAAYQIIKQHNQKAQVSIVLNLAEVVANSRNPFRHLFRLGYNWYRNKWLATRLRNSMDFMAINHYFYIEIGYKKYTQDYQHYSDLGWTLNPASLGNTVLSAWKSFRKPIYITEHGLADAADSRREWFIRESLTSLHQAIQAGADVRGYLHWSLLDNFEWGQGWWPKFGLVAVDRETQARTIRDSARYYAQIAENNSI